ncbi:ATP-dependent Clp protease proteolytic subunit [Cardinium endosymbiont of Culicoides punctatus]|uniref:ATP-dependent Clp protease proteolytic subunit n=1 Tax=Cardinium endosymbiont of Culicoides punctatus TaxID=2304601 RepID=UPI001058C823|nr:ATP-dependent Clp protease proteolytic subunit [Cardinium endosymbiont of Culicoides punctatus]TDG95377.1 ATP-dependent Clp protease proteolytic subunit [Cardinium endosymbiont of Culicoides punctatus]
MSDHKEFKQFVVKSGYASGLQVDSYVSDIENMTRSVIEERPAHFREVDVFSRLIMDRIIFLGTQVDDAIANIIIAQLLFLESVDSRKDILLYINSPGGSVYSGLGIYDTMQYISPNVSTICTGLAASMGAILLAGGATGQRSALPHARIMIHQPLGGAKGPASDMEITVQQIIEVKKDLHNILVKHTGRDYASVARHSDRDYWMRADQAKEYGIIDSILEKKSKQ